MNFNAVDSNILAEKLRQQNFEQFNTLVRMHLSFVLDLNTDDNEGLTEKGKLKKWTFTPFIKKLKPNRSIAEGLPLTQEGICQVYQLIEFLGKEPYICSEGIFRRTGSINRQQELKNLLSQGVTVNLDGCTFSVHDCASVLKGFLSELPEPLLTDAHYPAYCQIAELYGSCKKMSQEPRLLHALQLLLLLLPSENRILFKDVLNLLHMTASHEGSNKMSADNLATIFTPHFLCPRNLSPEGLHFNSQNLIGVVSFMIKKFDELFNVPPKLAVDIRAHYSDIERRKRLSPRENFNESVSDNFAASTVYTFVDLEKTAKENQSNPTETALAQLYAHIQSLPESSKKKKLVKQFNKENGHGTPLQVLRTNVSKNKSISSCIKKHIFQKSITKSSKKNNFPQGRASSEELLNSPLQVLTARAKLFCTKCDTSTDVSRDESISKKLKKSYASSENLENENCKISISEIKRSVSDPNISINNLEQIYDAYITSTPACTVSCTRIDRNFTPKNQERKSMSPITRSTRRMSRAMQETMMTPRSRKPVLLVSGTNINNLPKLEIKECHTDSVDEDISTDQNSFRKSKSLENISVNDQSYDVAMRSSLTNTFREYLQNRSMLTVTPTDLSFSSCTEDYCSQEFDIDQMSSSLLHCLNGYTPPNQSLTIQNVTKISNELENCENEKEIILKPKQFDSNGKPIIYETSF